MFKRLIVLTLIIVVISFVNSSAGVKLRDIASVEGIRNNQLFGYGLVAGLDGTGDKQGTEFTIQSLVNMLDRLGITVPQNDVRVKNVAAVMVTAKLPPFAKTGSLIDVTISSVGDSSSLEGGTLLLTPLAAANGQVYAVAQGPLSIGGLNTNNEDGTENHPTVGVIPGGATVEKEVDFAMDTSYISISFSGRGIADVVQAKSAINSFIGVDIAQIENPSTIKINIPSEFEPRYYDFMSSLLNIEIQPEAFAKVIIDERTGTVVMGSDVKISAIAISHGNLSITISDQLDIRKAPTANIDEPLQPQANNPNPSTEQVRVMMMPEAVTISDLVKALNALGVSPRNLISILQAVKSAGALYADLEIM